MSVEIQAPTAIAIAPSVLPDVGSLQPFSTNFGAQMGEGFNFNPSFGMEIKPLTIASSSGPDLHFPSLAKIEPQIHLDRTVPVPEIVFNEKLFEAIRPNVQAAEPLQIPPAFKIETPIISPVLEKEADKKARAEAVNLANILFPNSNEELSFWVAKIQEIELAEEDKIKEENKAAYTEHTAPEVIFPLTAQPLPEAEKEQTVEVKTQPQTLTKNEGGLETEVEPQTETQAEPQALASSGIRGPKIPVDGDGGERPSGEEPIREEPLNGSEPEWDEFITSEKHHVAKASLAKRQRIAREILEESVLSHGSDLITRVEGKIYKLDVPDPLEASAIASRKLEYPQIARNVETNLAYVEDRDNPVEVHNAINKTIASAPPIEATRKLQSVTRKRQSELAPEPKKIAAHGAKFIALLKEMVWVPTRKLKLEEPVEMQKVKKQPKKTDKLGWAQEGSNL